MGTPLHSQLALLREQEKLARDVYATLYARWEAPVFQSTSAAESLHMASAKLLLDWYHIDDPVGADPPGFFAGEELQTAYADLVTWGSGSLRDAYEVGVVVEKHLIALLKGLADDRQPRDIQLVAQTLLMSAQNHLIAFTSYASREPGRWRQAGEPDGVPRRLRVA